MAANAPHPEEAAQFQLALQAFTESDTAKALYHTVQALKNPGAGLLEKNEATPASPTGTEATPDVVPPSALPSPPEGATTLPLPPQGATTLPLPPQGATTLPPPPSPPGPNTLPPVPTILLPTMPATDFPIVVQNRTPL